MTEEGGDLGAFERESWITEMKKYEEYRHTRVIESLRKGTRHHLKGNFSDVEFSDGEDNLWYNSYDCTLHGKGECFYQMFKQEVCDHVKNNILPAIKNTEKESLISVVVSSWQDFKNTICHFSKIFEHLEDWIKDTKEVYTDDIKDGIEEIGLKLFRDEVVLEKKVLENLTSVLLELTNEHRKGSSIDFDELKTFCEILAEMNCYEQVFETNFLQQSEDYYKIIANQNLLTSSSSDCALKVEELVKAEALRNNLYLRSSTIEKNTRLLEKVLIADQLEAIVYKKQS